MTSEIEFSLCIQNGASYDTRKRLGKKFGTKGTSKKGGEIVVAPKTDLQKVEPESKQLSSLVVNETQVEVPKGAKKRIQKLMDQVKEDERKNIENAAKIFTVAQVAVNELRGGPPPKTKGESKGQQRALPAAQSQDEAPKGGARKRIQKLLDDLKENKRKDAKNAAGIFTVAQVAVNELKKRGG